MIRTLALLLAIVAAPVLADERAAYISAMCDACHGPNGASSGLIPRLDDLAPSYIASQLVAFRSGAREGTVMNRIAKGLRDADIEAIGRGSVPEAE